MSAITKTASDANYEHLVAAGIKEVQRRRTCPACSKMATGPRP